MTASERLVEPALLGCRHGRAAVVSIAQFRPEKAHGLQLEAFSVLLKKRPELKGVARLVLAGACRHADDETRLKALKGQAAGLGIEKHVRFEVNVPFGAPNPLCLRLGHLFWLDRRGFWWAQVG